MSEELKPCAYCGKEACIGMGYNEGLVCCGNRKCGTFRTWYTPKEWNTRPREEQLEKENEELREELHNWKLGNGIVVEEKWVNNLQEALTACVEALEFSKLKCQKLKITDCKLCAGRKYCVILKAIKLAEPFTKTPASTTAMKPAANCVNQEEKEAE